MATPGSTTQSTEPSQVQSPTSAGTIPSNIEAIRLDIKAFPMLYGTAWKKDKSAALVSQAIGLGFRGIDTACQPKHYNQKGVGDGIALALATHNLQRQDLFIQTKFSSIDAQDPKDIQPLGDAKPHPYSINDSLKTQVDKSLEVSLRDLQTSYLNSWVLHGPLRTYKDTLEVWRAMEAHVDTNRVHQLGISNCYNLKYLKQLFSDSKHKPMVIQNRFYGDTNWDVDIRSWARENGITYQSFWTLTGNPKLLATSQFQRLAQARQTTPENILYMYLIQRGCQPLNGSCSAHHIREDLAMAGNITDETKLSSADLQIIGGLIRDEF